MPVTIELRKDLGAPLATGWRPKTKSHLRSSSAILLSLLDFLAMAVLSFCSWLSRAFRMRSFIISMGVSFKEAQIKRSHAKQNDKKI